MCTFLADAVACGARVITGCFVEEILYEPNGSSRTRGGTPCRATGARVKSTPIAGGGGEANREMQRQFRVSASKAVILSAGSIHSPTLLLRSRLGGQHVGRHLRLHPVTGLSARFDEPVRIYEGAPMTAVCGAAEVCPRGTGYGAKIEIPSVHPGLMAAALGWRGGAAFTADLRHTNYTASAIVLQRDGGEEGGRVSIK